MKRFKTAQRVGFALVMSILATGCTTVEHEHDDDDDDDDHPRRTTTSTTTIEERHVAPVQQETHVIRTY